MTVSSGQGSSSPEPNPGPSKNGTPRRGRRKAEAPGPPKPTREPSGTDARSVPFCWVPNYVIDHFGPMLRATGLGIYLGLVRFMAQGDRSCWPSYATLARKIGVSRRTAILWVRRLVRLGLVEVVARTNSHGDRTSNVYRLVDPPLPAGDPPPGVTETLPPPSVSGGGVNPTPPSADPALGGVGFTLDLRTRSREQETGKGEAAPSPFASLPPEEEVDRLTRLWMDLLPSRKQSHRDAHAIEVAAEVRELLRQGWPAEELARSIHDPERDRNEWPREWRKRLLAAGRPARRQNGQAAVRDARSRAKAENEALDQDLNGTAKGQAALDKLRSRIGRMP